MEKHSDTDLSREYARKQYIEPARRRGDAVVRITAGDIHRALGLRNRVPAVCQALRSKKFLAENGLSLEKTEGPPSGLSTTVTFTYRLQDSGQRTKGQREDADSFLRLRGIAKDIFRDLGGGEAFIRKERERFSFREENRQEEQ